MYSNVVCIEVCSNLISFPIYYGDNGEIMPDQRRYASTIVLDHRELTLISDIALSRILMLQPKGSGVSLIQIYSRLWMPNVSPSQPLGNGLDELLLLSSYSFVLRL